MSSSIREIHQWIYDKIILVEKIDQDIEKWAESQGLPINEIMAEIIKQYGKPTGARPLNKVANKSNIHVWLYEQVKSTELRQAALITKILEIKAEYKEDIKEIFAKNGEDAAREYKGALPGNPEEIYIVLNDFLLDGMPTDRVNQILSGSENVMIWRTTLDVHKAYWDEVNGDVTHLYDLREAWVKAFVDTLTPGLVYERRPNGDHKIVKK